MKDLLHTLSEWELRANLAEGREWQQHTDTFQLPELVHLSEQADEYGCDVHHIAHVEDVNDAAYMEFADPAFALALIARVRTALTEPDYSDPQVQYDLDCAAEQRLRLKGLLPAAEATKVRARIAKRCLPTPAKCAGCQKGGQGPC